MCKESRERCHLLWLEWGNITPKNTKVLPAGTCSHSDQECQCQCAGLAKYIIWIELHFDIEFVISYNVVWLRPVLVLSNKNSIPCVVVRKQQMSENLLLLGGQLMDLPSTFLWLSHFLCLIQLDFISIALNHIHRGLSLIWPFVVQVCITHLVLPSDIRILPTLAFSRWKHPYQRGSGQTLDLALIRANQNTSWQCPGVRLAWQCTAASECSCKEPLICYCL